MNTPYIKQYDENGKLLNPIVGRFYQSCNNAPYSEKESRGDNPYPNRQIRNHKVKSSNNRKSTRGRKIQIIHRKRIYDDVSEEFIGYKTIAEKKIIHVN